MPFQNDILGGASGQAGAYDIDYSMYIGDAPDSEPKLARTFNQTGSTSPKWTFATWYKKGKLTTSGKVIYYFEPNTVASAATVDLKLTNDAQAYFNWTSYGGAGGWDWQSDGTPGLMLRDYAGWMHITHVIDHSTSPYVWLYLNGVLIDPNIWGTKTGAGYAANYSPVSGDVFKIGSNNSNQLASGYFADTYWIEQQALAPVGNFGEIDEDTGQFVATKYTGPAMTGNSFYLNYSDSSNFGTDSSGLGNNFTASDIPATQQMIDTPQNSTGGNFCVMNPLIKAYGTMTLSEGNLKSVGDGNWNAVASTQLIESGKWYWETLIGGSNAQFGIWPDNAALSILNAQESYGNLYYGGNGQVRTDGSFVSYGASFGSGDIIGTAVDMGASTITWYKNNVSQGAYSFSGSVSSANAVVPGGVFNSQTDYWNFGQDSSFAGEETAQGNTDGNDNGDFYYTPPTGYLALCTNNLPDPSIALPGENFSTILYTGDGGATQAETGVGFAPDFVWVKDRGAAYPPNWWDTVRGPQKLLESSSTGMQSTHTDMLNSFDADGFTHGNQNAIGKNTNTYVAWNWKGGGTPTVDNSAGAGNVPTAGSVKINGSNSGSALAGSIAATRLTANTTSGFSICSFTGNETAGATIAHGLSQAPEWVIAKVYVQGSGAATSVWYTMPLTIGSDIQGEGSVSLDAGAYDDYAGYWNDTAPSSSVVTLGSYSNLNRSSNIIMYSFHSVEGYSKFGGYQGNGNADGIFIYTGFRPKFFLCKNITQTEGWEQWDAAREPYNKMSKKLSLNTSDAEYTANTTTYAVDLLSNGVKLRTTYSAVNDNLDYFFYAAYAEWPFKYTRAR